MTTTENKVIQCRRDTAANWASNNPVPKSGELCFETDTGITKIGDGSTAYNSLVPFRQTTATTTELNKLHSLSTTNTELGYVHGVTSAIQTQINSKFAKADIQTSFGETLSDEKVASEKLVKNNLDAKQDGITVANNSMLKASVLSAMNIVGENNSGRRYDEPKTLAKMISAAHSTFDLSKFTVVGSPTITDDGFMTLPSADTLSYLRSNVKVSDLSGKSFEIQYKTKVTSDFKTVDDNRLFGFFSRLMCEHKLYSTNGQISAIFKVDNTDAGTQDNVSITQNIPSAVNIDDDLFVKVGYIKATKTFYLKLYINDILTIDESAISNYDLVSTNDLIQFGCWGTTISRRDKGIADLKYVLIKIDGKEVFSGNKTGIDTIKSDAYTVVGSPTISDDGVASGFSSSNYVATNYTGTTTDFEVFIPFTVSTIDATHNILGTMLFIYANGRFVSDIGDGSKYGDVYASAGTSYLAKISLRNGYHSLNISTDNGVTWTEVFNVANANSYTFNNITIGCYNNYNYFKGLVNLNGVKFIVNGNLVYQPCLKIPYTLAANDKKFINPIYENRAIDMAEQFGVAPYHILDEDNGNFAMPYGSVEEKIAPKIVVGHYEDGASAWEQYLDRTMIQRGTMVADTEVTFPCSDDYADTNFTLSCPFSAKTTSGFTPSASGTYIAVGKF